MSGDGQVLWRSKEKVSLSWPRDMDWVDDERFLVADSRNHRVLILNRNGRIEWEYVTERLSQPYDADYMSNGNVLFSDQRHFRVVEVDRGGNIVWSFCNFYRNVPLFEYLTNGRFDQVDAGTSAPIGWLRCLLNAEGAPVFYIDSAGGQEGRASLGLQNTGGGAVWWQQTVIVEGGKTYRVGGNIKCKKAAGGAAIQVAFLDTYGGFIHEVKQLPGTKSVSGSSNWTPRELEIEAPGDATAADIRLVLMGKGTGWFDDIFCDVLAWL